MKCPVCKKIPLHSLESDELPPRLVCDECGGQWVKSCEYWKWLDKHGENLPEKPVEEATPLEVTDSTKAKLCPECGHLLSRKKVGRGVDFHIDRCAACGGFWFDRNEWEVLKSLNLHDDVHRIFSAVWQHRISKEDYRRTYEKRMEILLGLQDFERVRDFKRWAADHPKRNTVMAFLTDKDV